MACFVSIDKLVMLWVALLFFDWGSRTASAYFDSWPLSIFAVVLFFISAVWGTLFFESFFKGAVS